LAGALTALDLPAGKIGENQQIRFGFQQGGPGADDKRNPARQSASLVKLRCALWVCEIFTRKLTDTPEYGIIAQVAAYQRIDFRGSLPAIPGAEHVLGTQALN